MINSIPILGWLLSIVGNISVSIPFWLCWTYYGLGAAYFDFLPAKYQSLPFWHCVGLFVVVSILKSALTPSFASVTQTNKDSA